MEDDSLNDMGCEAIFLFSIYSLQIKVIKAISFLSMLQNFVGMKISTEK